MSEYRRAALARILADNPTLWWGGYWTDWHVRTDAQPSLPERRAETLSDQGLGQFRRAVEFIEQAPRAERVNRCRTTYGWKHVAERWHAQRSPAYENHYIGEGAFIAAAIISGLTVQRTRRGFTHVNLSIRARGAE